MKSGGNIVIAVFAVERAQELMFYLSRLIRQKRVPRLPVFLDSPMAMDVTEVFKQHLEFDVSIPKYRGVWTVEF